MKRVVTMRAANRREKLPRKQIRVGAVPLLAILVAGPSGACSRAVGGTVVPAPGMTPHPVTGPTILRILLDDRELSKLLGQAFRGDSSARVGGPEQLFDMDASPAQCAGVVFGRQKSSYRSGSVKNVAQQSLWNAGSEAKVINVDESVIALPTAAAADALFAQFSQQWEHCNGTIVTNHGLNGQPFSTATVSDVHAVNSVLAATVRTRIIETVTHGRALGVRVNCLVEVDVAYFKNHLDDGAVKVARQMMDKVSKLS